MEPARHSSGRPEDVEADGRSINECDGSAAGSSDIHTTSPAEQGITCVFVWPPVHFASGSHTKANTHVVARHIRITRFTWRMKVVATDTQANPRLSGLNPAVSKTLRRSWRLEALLT